MKHLSVSLSKAVVFALALAAVIMMFKLPQTEGRAANLSLIKIYKDPFIVYFYIASIPFFVTLYQTFKFVGYVGENKTFSKLSLSAVRKIKYCILAIPLFILAGDIFVVINANGDDFAGFVALSIYASLVLISMAIAAALLERHIKIKLKGKK